MRPTLHPLLATAILALAASGAQAVRQTVYTSAKFVVTDPVAGTVELDGFGRVITAAASSASSRRVASFSTLATAREPFFDTWNIDVGGIAPGLYAFSAFAIDATGSLQFDSVTFNSIDDAGKRRTILFDLNATRTQAVGSGQFTVRASCPIESCVWIDIAGTQLDGAVGEGYGGTTTAALVPEPASVALMLAGLVALGAWVRRRPAT